MYSVSIRNNENVAGPAGGPPPQPTAASAATPAAMTPIVRPEPQPYVPLWVIAYTSDTSPPVTSTAARASNDFTAVSRLSARRRGARKNAARPTGTLTKKIHDQ